MELNKESPKTLLALLVGLIIGWFLQAWLITPSNSGTNNHLLEAPLTRSNVSDPLDESVGAELDNPTRPGTPESTALEQQERSSAIASFTAQELIDYIASIDDESFWQLDGLNDIRLALAQSPLLFDEFMLSLLDIQDKNLNRRLLYLLENINSYYPEEQNAVRFPIEKWIMQRITSNDRSSEWLSYMAKLGVQSKETYLFFGRRLDAYVDADQINQILSILSRRPIYFNQSFSADETAQIYRAVEPFFNSENDQQRMFAVASLSGVPFELSSTQLLPAMFDDSRRVRMTAMRVIRDNGFNSAEISKKLMVSLEDSSLSAYERLGAYEVLSRFDLSQEQYESVYRFAETERLALEQEFLAERRAAQNRTQ